ncbi:MAG: hypothetical protein CO098_18545 [Bacteroidetes bacterium CG_4_9_14_3_um_filter_41_19]|nr:MAG: hypothetical protein CO098_18545 [Bacteroidetes bacterium CG_4_9_14_3_um_filter_41_19]
MEKELIGYFLPEGLLEHFRITNVEELGEVSKKRMVLQIELEEINSLPKGYDSGLYESKGFYPVTLIQDFPIRGKAVYLAIKRRRRRHKVHRNQVIYNNYSIIADGSRLTQELSAFLKGTGRDLGRYH